jgi:hypothetical protein
MSDRLAALGQTVAGRSLATVPDALAALTLSTVRREAARLAPRLSPADRDDVVAIATLAALASLTDDALPVPGDDRTPESVRVAARRALSLTLRRYQDDQTDGRSLPVGTLSGDDDDDTPESVRTALTRSATPAPDAPTRTTDRDRVAHAVTLAEREADPVTLAVTLRAVQTLPVPAPGTNGRPVSLTTHAAGIAGAHRSSKAFRAALADTLDTLREGYVATCAAWHTGRRHYPWSDSAALRAARLVDRTPSPAARPTRSASPVVRLTNPAHGPAATLVIIDGRTVAVHSPDDYADAVAAWSGIDAGTYVPTDDDRAADRFVDRLAGPGAARTPSRKGSRVGSTGPTVPAAGRSSALTGDPLRLAPALGTFTLPTPTPVPMPRRPLAPQTVARIAADQARAARLASAEATLTAERGYADRLAARVERAALAARSLAATDTRPSGPAARFIGPLTAGAAYAAGVRW